MTIIHAIHELLNGRPELTLIIYIHLFPILYSPLQTDTNNIYFKFYLTHFQVNNIIFPDISSTSATGNLGVSQIGYYRLVIFENRIFIQGITLSA